MRLRKNSGNTSLLHRGTIVFSGDPIRAQFWTNYREDTLAQSGFSQTAGPEVIVSSKTDNAWEFYAPDTASVTTMEFTLSATDYKGLTNAVSWDLELHPVRPTAVATVSDSVSEGDMVTLSGAASYAGFKYFHSADAANLPSQTRPIKSYQWTQTGGPDLTLNCALTGPEIEAAGCENGVATFTAPQVDADTSLGFELTVTDERDLTGAVGLSFGVSAARQTGQSRENVIFPPTACAGDDLTGAPGETVTLQGTCSVNPQGEWYQLTHSWSQTSGPSVTLSSAVVGDPSFTGPSDTAVGTTLEFELTVSDIVDQFDSDTVQVTVVEIGSVSADAGEDVTAIIGQTVTLNGSNSENSYGGPSGLTYSWSQSSGPTVTLSDGAVASPSFTVPTDADDEAKLEFELTVTDQLSSSGSDTVVVTADRLGPPTANAGPDLTAAPGESVTLQGTGSANPYGQWHELTHSWSQTSGPTVTLSSSAVGDPSFTVPSDAADGTTLEFELTVTDLGGDSDTDTVTVTVQENVPPVQENTPPVVAELSPVRVFSAGTVELAGQATDTEDDAESLSYLWEQTDGTPTVTLTAANTSVLSFTAPDVTGETILTFRLSVTDSGGLTAQEEATVTILPTPAACAGDDLTGEPGAEITLEGICSTNPYGEWWQMAHQWTQLSGLSVTLTHPQASANHAADKFGDPRFTLPTDAEGGATLEFQLTVTDEEGGTDTGTVTVTVSVPVPVE